MFHDATLCPAKGFLRTVFYLFEICIYLGFEIQAGLVTPTGEPVKTEQRKVMGATLRPIIRRGLGITKP